MVNQPQGHNSMDSSAALLQQQQHNFDVQVSDCDIVYILRNFIATNCCPQYESNNVSNSIHRANKANKNSTRKDLRKKITCHSNRRSDSLCQRLRKKNNNQIEPQIPNRKINRPISIFMDTYRCSGSQSCFHLPICFAHRFRQLFNVYSIMLFANSHKNVYLSALSLLLFWLIHRRLMSCLNCVLFEHRYAMSLRAVFPVAIRSQPHSELKPFPFEKMRGKFE